MLKKFQIILNNLEIIKIFLNNKNKSSIISYLEIKESRKKMVHACNQIDSQLAVSNDILTIVEKTCIDTNLPKYILAWYALVRSQNLQKIVETGTSMGWSTFMILTALKRNGSGHLYSFDLNDSPSVKSRGGVGYLVSEDLKNNWTLSIGDTKELLLPLLQKLSDIDFFIHDSEHSYQMMMYEYNLGWKFLKKNGILGSDDINHSDAFKEFSNTYKNSISQVITFQEISRQSDNLHLRPYIGYMLKK